MERVLGIGGLFFRSKAPSALAQWYADHLGIDVTPDSYDEDEWYQAAGPTVFAPFPADTEYFGSDAAFMVNFRVRDMAAMVAQLRAVGVEVTEYPEQPNGLFVHLTDPEGNRIELWEPRGARYGEPR